MKVISRFVLLLIIFGCFCTTAYGDGKFFFIEEVPADIPYQRACLIFHEGFETLILQSKYEFSQATDVNSIGWVVPVPAVPELGSSDPINADIFFLKLSLHAQPKLFHIYELILSFLVLLFFACIITMIVFLILYPFLNNIKLSRVVWHRVMRICNIIILVCFFVFFFSILPHLGKANAGIEGVEVVKAEQVGIYDVKVIKGDSAEALVDWLKENEFSFSDKDIEVMEDYVNRQWCFVTAKVQQTQDINEEKFSLNGMVAPLILKFETEKAIYPLALTSVIGTDTEVLLYTLSENKLNCNKRMKLRYSGMAKTRNLPSSYIYSDGSEIKVLFQNIPEEMTICKFKEKLTSEQMKEDLEFKDALNNEPYKETKIVW